MNASDMTTMQHVYNPYSCSSLPLASCTKDSQHNHPNTTNPHPAASLHPRAPTPLSALVFWSSTSHEKGSVPGLGSAVCRALSQDGLATTSPRPTPAAHLYWCSREQTPAEHPAHMKVSVSAGKTKTFHFPLPK